MLCPRCQFGELKEPMVLNATSHKAAHPNVYICEECGLEEALLEVGFFRPTKASNLREARMLFYVSYNGGIPARRAPDDAATATGMYDHDDAN